MEFFFLLSDIEKGGSRRRMIMRQMLKHIRLTAPVKYHDYLTPNFELGGKRRVVDWGYMKSMHSSKFTLVPDDEVVSMDGLQVRTAKGVKIDADIVIYSTGFEVHNHYTPFVITSSQCDEDITTRFQTTSAKAYRGTFVHGFPNLITLFGPNVGTGHSSLVFAVEAQISMALKIIAPILKHLKRRVNSYPAPNVEVTDAAERAYFRDLRAEMKKKTFELDGGVCFYANDKGHCIVSHSPFLKDHQLTLPALLQAIYPWSQIHFWWNAMFPSKSHFKWTAC
ncbi:hypothetical protein RQP46_008156 [Phenoliferia psychrophenolica]